jgi:hypothetical protein
MYGVNPWATIALSKSGHSSSSLMYAGLRRSAVFTIGFGVELGDPGPTFSVRRVAHVSINLAAARGHRNAKGASAVEAPS